MEWLDAVLPVLVELVSSVLVGLASLVLVGLASSVLVGLASSVLFNALERSKFRRLKQTTSGADAAPRQIRRQHRKPATQLPRTYRNCTPEMLARSIRCSGRVPIDHRKPRTWRLFFWQALKDVFLSSSTNPKSAFTLTDWQFQPITPTSLAKRYPYSGGSILRLSLHPHENRSHLKRSLKADKSGASCPNATTSRRRQATPTRRNPTTLTRKSLSRIAGPTKGTPESRFGSTWG